MPAATSLSSLDRIGIDESGKGDYFGPLVIAAVFVTPALEQDLALMQVRDSKTISACSAPIVSWPSGRSDTTSCMPRSRT